MPYKNHDIFFNRNNVTQFQLNGMKRAPLSDFAGIPSSGFSFKCDVTIITMMQVQPASVGIGVGNPKMVLKTNGDIIEQ